MDLQWALKSIEEFSTRGIKEIYHVGDFGLYTTLEGVAYIAGVSQASSDHGITIFITPGNHENQSWIETLPVTSDGLQWISSSIAVMPRGYRWRVGERTFVSLGGAASIGFLSQTKDLDWWPSERISRDDLYRTALGGEADVMITHEAPLGIPTLEAIKKETENDWEEIERSYAYQSQKMITLAVGAVRPRLLFHGHYHHGYQEDVVFEGVANDGFATRVIGLNENGMNRNLGIFNVLDYGFEWIKYQ